MFLPLESETAPFSALQTTASLLPLRQTLSPPFSGGALISILSGGVRAFDDLDLDPLPK